MKKFLSLLLVCALLLGTAMAETSLVPQHTDPDTLFTAEDSFVMARFDGKTAFDEDGRMAFTVIEDDLYPADAVKALKAGDKVTLYGQEFTVKSVEEQEDFVQVNVEGEEYGFELRPEDATGEMLYVSETDIPQRTEIADCDLPLADQVHLHVWYADANGDPSPELGDETVAAADVKAFFAARSDPAQNDYLNTAGEHVTIGVHDGKVTEIWINWGSDD